MTKRNNVDKVFLIPVIFLLVLGFATFISASLGVLAKDSALFNSIAFKQFFFGIVLGLIGCFVLSRVNYKLFKKHSLFIFITSLITTAFVFIPGVGTTINGATRWIIIFGISFQPVALLNFGFVAFWAAWLSHKKERVVEIKHGLFPLILILFFIGITLLFQPDTDSFLVLCITGMSMLFLAGGKIKHLMYVFILGVLCITALALTRPYVMSRIMTFINPSDNSLTSSYQIQQSYIAIGSGGMFGRGLGQSIQKYKFLPESISDSIFAVLGEELGFLGSLAVIIFFLFFVQRGFKIDIDSPDNFSRLLVSGIVILIIVQSFINIGSILGLIPFSGIPLAFFSQGGTSMFFMLLEIGVILNVSRFKEKIIRE